MHLVGIVAVGDELLSGAVIDTNSAYLAGVLKAEGFSLVKVLVARDREEEIVSALKYCLSNVDIILVTGGLGPTEDDRSRQAIADFLGVKLFKDQASVEKLELHCKLRDRVLNQANLRQAYFPVGAKVIENAVGTANAFITLIESGSGKSVPIISLPGVPRELKHLYQEKILSWLKQRFPEREQLYSCGMRFFGIPESQIAEQVESCKLPNSINVQYRPQIPTVWLSLNSKNLEILHEAQQQIIAVIGEEFLISTDEKSSLPRVVGELLRQQGKTFAAAESCTGGLIAHRMISIPGASDYFRASLVTYSNDAKQVFCGVRSGVIESHGAVSKEVALMMAHGARHRSGADIAVSVSGIAGPAGATSDKALVDKAPGTAWIGFSTVEFEKVFSCYYPVERNTFREYSAAFALDIVRRSLLGYPLPMVSV